MSRRVGRWAEAAAGAGLLVVLCTIAGWSPLASAAGLDEGGCPVAAGAVAPRSAVTAADEPAGVAGLHAVALSGDPAYAPDTTGPVRRSGGDEPLDPRSTGWKGDRKNPLPWILIAIGGAVVVAAVVVGIYLWNDNRVHFPDDTLGVRTFRP